MPPSTTVARSGSPRIALGPEDAPDWARDAIEAGDGEVVDLEDAEALVWTAASDPVRLQQAIAQAPQLEWIQLPWAGIERYIHLIDDERQWTCGKGVYAEPVAELALSLMLAGLRGVGHYARTDHWSEPVGRNLTGSNVTILGGGGITESLLRMLVPFDCHTTVVRNHVTEMDGADEVLEADRYIDALHGADVVVVALALTPQTEGMLSRSEFEMMDSDAWLVNVGRGQHVVTDDLVWALQNGVIGGAALDVTDPKPLPDGHPLWTLPNCLITPHVGNTPEMAVPLLSQRITANVRRFADGEPLLGPVDPELGY